MWRIWVKYFDEEGNLTGYGYFCRFYKRKANAERAAKRQYGDSSMFQYVVAQTCPW